MYTTRSLNRNDRPLIRILRSFVGGPHETPTEKTNDTCQLNNSGYIHSTKHNVAEELQRCCISSRIQTAGNGWFFLISLCQFWKQSEPNCSGFPADAIFVQYTNTKRLSFCVDFRNLKQNPSVWSRTIQNHQMQVKCARWEKNLHFWIGNFEDPENDGVLRGTTPPPRAYRDKTAWVTRCRRVPREQAQSLDIVAPKSGWSHRRHTDMSCIPDTAKKELAHCRFPLFLRKSEGRVVWFVAFHACCLFLFDQRPLTNKLINTEIHLLSNKLHHNNVSCSWNAKQSAVSAWASARALTG